MITPPICPICGQDSSLKFANLDDKLFRTPVVASYYRCGNHQCQHMFNWPVPATEQIPALYAQYSTHQRVPLRGDSTKARFLEAITSLFGAVDGLSGQIQRWRIMDMQDRKGAVLDVGCGSGNLLEALRESGHTDLEGVDFDPKAVQVAREAGLNVSAGEVNAVARRDFDVVLMNHVIEHLPSPEKALREVANHLKPSGIFVIRTPNSRSFLAQCFGRDWRGLEPPRHLNIFTTQSLALLAKKTGFRPVEIGTTNAMLQGIFLESVELHAGNRAGKRRTLTRLTLRVFFPLVVLVASLRHILDHSSGEEVCAVLQKED